MMKQFVNFAKIEKCKIAQQKNSNKEEPGKNCTKNFKLFAFCIISILSGMFKDMCTIFKKESFPLIKQIL